MLLKLVIDDAGDIAEEIELLLLGLTEAIASHGEGAFEKIRQRQRDWVLAPFELGAGRGEGILLEDVVEDDWPPMVVVVVEPVISISEKSIFKSS